MTVSQLFNCCPSSTSVENGIWWNEMNIKKVVEQKHHKKRNFSCNNSPIIYLIKSVGCEKKTRDNRHQKKVNITAWTKMENEKMSGIGLRMAIGDDDGESNGDAECFLTKCKSVECEFVGWTFRI